MSDGALLNQVRAGLEPWQRGDLDALVPILHPDVELLVADADPWDCRGRETVIELLRARIEEDKAAGTFELEQVAADQVIAVRTTAIPDGPGPERTTLITFRRGLAVSMRQFLSRAAALAAAG